MIHQLERIALFYRNIKTNSELTRLSTLGPALDDREVDYLQSWFADDLVDESEIQHEY
jgi:hypothetical protein